MIHDQVNETTGKQASIYYFTTDHHLNTELLQLLSDGEGRRVLGRV